MSAPLDLRARETRREQPNNIEAEQALLGCLLYDHAALEAVAGLTEESFYEPFHGRLFATVRQISGKGRNAEIILVGDRLANDPAFVELGGLRYLADLVDRAPPTPNAPDYARLIADLALRRAAIQEAESFAHAAANDRDLSAEDLIADVERRLSAIASSGPSREAWTTAADVIEQALDAAQDRDGTIDVGAGVLDVDEFVGGFGRGEVAIIAGRPGMFKSGVASAIAKANAARGKGSLFFSQEMSAEQLGLRLACDLAYSPGAPVYSGKSDNPAFSDARRNALTSHQWAALREAGARVKSWPLLFDTRPGLTVSTIEACARRAIRRWERQGIEPGPVIIDHLGIVRPEKDRQGSRHAETADVSRGLAEMAKRLNVPVIALCQLNRGVEGRDDKRPQLSDLRQAGEIEEDARLVIFLYRPEYYFRPPLDGVSESPADRAERETKLDKARNKLFWIVAKNNNGPLGQVETFCDVACAVVRESRGRWVR